MHLLCPNQYAVDNRNQDDDSRLISPDDEHLSWGRCVGNLDDTDLGDDFWQTMSLDGERLFLRVVGADHDGVGAGGEDCSNVGQE